MELLPMQSIMTHSTACQATQTSARPGGRSAATVDRTIATASLRADLETLAAEVDLVKQSVGFQHVLDTMSVFWKYSPTNRWFIGRACPHATHVAGRKTWAKIGRTPFDGAKPIFILAPTARGFPFIAVPVFDVSQTEGVALPALDLQLTGDRAPVARLERAAAKLGVRVSELHTWRPISGVSHGGAIEIVAGLAPAERVSVLAHELAHELLHTSERARKRGPWRSDAERETEAEATSYVVLRALGLASKAPTYIAWRGGDGATVLRSMGRIQRAARQILNAARPRSGGHKKASE